VVWHSTFLQTCTFTITLTSLLGMDSLRGVVSKHPVPDVNDERWQPAGNVCHLNIYPLKSCKATRLQGAKVEKFGLSDENGIRDRQFMVVNSKNLMVTGRQYTKLVLIEVSTVPGRDDKAKFSAPGMDDLMVNLPNTKDSSILVNVEVFGDHTNGYDLGQETSDWISEYIKSEVCGPFRVIFHPFNPQTDAENPRRNERISDSNMRLDDTCLYADVSGFMACTTASVEGLNQRLEGKLVLDPFFCRPNIVIDNIHGKPFEEDDWLFVKIGPSVVFRIINWSDRCIFTTIDPYSGARNPDMEPLKTLKKFRCGTIPSHSRHDPPNDPYFGINLGIDSPTQETIRIGDPVQVIRMQRSNLPLSQKVILAAISVSALVSIVAIGLRKYR